MRCEIRLADSDASIPSNCRLASITSSAPGCEYGCAYEKCAVTSSGIPPARRSMKSTSWISRSYATPLAMRGRYGEWRTVTACDGLVDDLHRGEDRRVEPFEQPAAERHAPARGRGRAARRPRERSSAIGFSTSTGLPSSMARFAHSTCEPVGDAMIRRVDAPERVELREPPRPPPLGQRLAGLGVGIDDAGELGFHRLRDDARRATRPSPPSRRSRSVTGAIFTGARFCCYAPSDARTASTIWSRSASERFGCTGNESTSRAVARAAGHVARDDVRVLAVTVVVENNTRVIYAALHASRRELARRARRDRGAASSVTRIVYWWNT